MSGYIAIQRGLLGHPLFKPERFTEREAWIWLIEEAAWKPGRVRVGSEVVELARGQLAHSVRYMAKAWQWEQTRVHRFLKKLRSNGMIENAQENFAKITTPNATAAQHQTQRISICNYDKYQSPRNSVELETATPNATGPQQDRNKEEPLNHLTKEIDRDATHAEVLKIAKVTSDDPFFFGSKHGVDILLERGYSPATICAGSARAMAGKSRPPPWSYFAKCIESENEQRSQPAKPEISRGKPETLTDTANRLAAQVIGFGPKPGSSSTDGDPVRVLPQGGRERS